MQGNLFFIFYSGKYLLSIQSKKTLFLFTKQTKGTKSELFEPWNSQC